VQQGQGEGGRCPRGSGAPEGVNVLRDTKTG